MRTKKESTRSIGDRGEMLARHFLKKSGYQILESNVHKRLGEIDLIAQDPDSGEIIFIEVKARKNSDFGTPEAFVNHRKIDRIQKAALLWLGANDHHDKEIRIDVIAIENNIHPARITHLKNVTQL